MALSHENRKPQVSVNHVPRLDLTSHKSTTYLPINHNQSLIHSHIAIHQPLSHIFTTLHHCHHQPSHKNGSPVRATHPVALPPLARDRELRDHPVAQRGARPVFEASPGEILASKDGLTMGTSKSGKNGIKLGCSAHDINKSLDPGKYRMFGYIWDDSPNLNNPCMVRPVDASGRSSLNLWMCVMIQSIDSKVCCASL